MPMPMACMPLPLPLACTPVPLAHLRVEAHTHVIVEGAIERQRPHEELDREGRRLVGLIECWLRRRLGRRLGVGLGDEE